MSDRQKQKKEPDSQNEGQLARRLEQIHERLLRSDTEPAFDVNESGPELADAEHLLKLLDRIKHLPVDETPAVATLQETTGENRHSRPSGGFAQIGRDPVSGPLIDKDLDRILDAHKRTIGRFQILERIGQGGFGLVFRAYDPQLNRDVAIKVPRPETLFTEELQTRFVREAKTTAALSHPNIVTVYEAGNDGSIYFLVSEYVPGENLGQWLARRDEPLNHFAAVNLLVTLADAVHHAHSRGVLHRDLKPSNILLQHAPETEIEADELASAARVTDFGLAKFENDRDHQTHSGSIVGTPAFMSPEQAVSGGRRIGAESDIFSLGVLLYMLLTGKTPFQGGSMIETIRAVQQIDPPPPSRLNRTIPRDLDAIVLKCLEKNPVRRYRSAWDLIDDLKKFLSGYPVSARRTSRPEKIVRWAGRNPVVAALATLLFVALAGGLIATSSAFVNANYHRRVAEQRQQRLYEKSAQLSDAVEQLFVELATSSEVQNAKAEGLRTALLTTANQFYRQFLSESPDEPRLKADYANSLYHFAEINCLLGDYRQALRLVDQAMAEASPPEVARLIAPTETARWMFLAARANQLLGDFAAAGEKFDAALELLDSHSVADDDPHVLMFRASLLTNQAHALLFQRKLEKINAIAAEAEIIWRLLESDSANHSAITGESMVDRAATTFLLADSLRSNNEISESEDIYFESIQQFETALEGQPHSVLAKFGLARTLQGLGISQAMQEKKEQARQSYLRALELLDQLAIDHPTIELYRDVAGSTRYSLAATEFIDGELEAAEGLLLKNISEKQLLVEEFPQSAAKQYSRLGETYNLLYVIYNSKPDSTFEQKLEALQQSIAALQRADEMTPNWGQVRLGIGRAESNLASLHFNAGDLDTAEQYLEKAEQRMERLVEEEPDFGEARSSLASIYASQATIHHKRGDLVEALRYCDLAFELAGPGGKQPVIATKARVLAAQGSHVASQEVLQTLGCQHAKTPDDFIRLAAAAFELAQECSDSAAELAYREVARSILKQGQPEDDESARVYQQGILDHELLSDLDASKH